LASIGSESVLGTATRNPRNAALAAHQRHGTVAVTSIVQNAEEVWVVTVASISDTINEDDEVIDAGVSVRSGLGLGHAVPDDYQGVVTIRDDDRSLVMRPASMPMITVTEGPQKSNSLMPFQVTLSKPPVAVASLEFTVVRALGSNPAELGVDVAGASGTLTFLPGQQTATIKVTTIDDNIDEATEHVVALLSNPRNLDFPSTLGGPARELALFGDLVDND
jgi:hypothetical protein